MQKLASQRELTTFDCFFWIVKKLENRFTHSLFSWLRIKSGKKQCSYICRNSYLSRVIIFNVAVFVRRRFLTFLPISLCDK